MRNSDARSGGVLTGLLITGIGLVCLAVVIGLAIARSISVHTRVHTLTRNGGDDVSIETPAGNFSVHAHSRSSGAVDVPSYPGALHSRESRDSGGSASFEWTSRDGHEGGMTVAGDEMITDDPPDRVMEFYQSRDPHWIIAENRKGRIRMELTEGGYKRFVVIQEKGDGTHIGVASIGGPAAN